MRPGGLVEPAVRRVLPYRGKFLHIQIENRCETAPVFRGGLPVTTKADGENHGFGMISMKRIVEKYGGAMTVEWEDDIFRVSMTIPIPAETCGRT